jgi:imidazolonepropionase-like amidohydrolase
VTRATTIVNARVFDGDMATECTSVRFVDGVISDCSAVSAAHDGDEVFDAEGGTLLPGLIDSHVHLVPGALAQSLAFGVTTVLDMFSLPVVADEAKEQSRSLLDVADVRSSTIGATAPGGHPSAAYAPIPTLERPEQAEGFVEQRVAEGADYLKIIVTPGGLWPSLDRETISALVTAAHRRGIVTVGHVNSLAGLEDMVAAGIDVVAHVPFDVELSETVIERIARAGIAVGPTLATVENTLGMQVGRAVLDDERLELFLGERARESASGAERKRGGRLPPYARAEHNVRLLARAGVEIIAGTDAPNPGTVFGASLHRELELLVRAGVEPARALAAATSAPARLFALDDRGRVAVGLRADLLLVTGDPLDDITQTRGIAQIWRGGVAIERRVYEPSPAENAQLEAFDARVAAAVAAVRAGGTGVR